MNALHRYVKRHPWLESTLRVAYWVGVCAILFALVTALYTWVGHMGGYGIAAKPWATVADTCREVLAGEYDDFWADAAMQMVPIVFIGAFWLAVGVWFARRRKRKPSPLALYLAFLLSAVVVLIVLALLTPNY